MKFASLENLANIHNHKNSKLPVIIDLPVKLETTRLNGNENIQVSIFAKMNDSKLNEVQEPYLIRLNTPSLI
jgi:hypothetical protein